MDSRIDQHWENDIEALSEQLGSWRITEEDISEETTEYIDEMLIVPALAIVQNKQAEILKSMVLNPEWFNGNRMKFKDW